MRWNGIKTVVIVGVGAEVGVVPTLMTASNLGFRRIAVSDCLRPTDPQRMDDAMRYIASQAIVKTHADIIEVWRTATPTPSP
jgi:nicotinamidase-related amidase